MTDVGAGRLPRPEAHILTSFTTFVSSITKNTNRMERDANGSLSRAS